VCEGPVGDRFGFRYRGRPKGGSYGRTLPTSAKGKHDGGGIDPVLERRVHSAGSLPAVPRLAILVTLALLTAGMAAYALLSAANAERWPRLRRLDPSLRILGRPADLLRLAARYVGPPGAADDPTVETRHEAVRALLWVQKPLFQVTTRPAPGLTVDHVVVEAVPSGRKGTVQLLATPTRDPDRFDQVGEMRYGYWSTEILEFDESGRLLDRRPYPQ
jgi:hypothetical protein